MIECVFRAARIIFRMLNETSPQVPSTLNPKPQNLNPQPSPSNPQP